MRPRHALVGSLAIMLCAGATACGGSSSSSASTSAALSTSSSAASSSAASSSSAANTSPVTFAVISYSIPGADSLTELNQGAQAAAKTLNAQGGFGGRHVTVITCNSMLTPSAATVCAHKTLGQHPIAEFGCELAWSASGLEIYAAAHVPSINCLNDPVDYHNPWSFGIVGGTIGQNNSAAKWICTMSNVHNVVNLFPDVADYHSVVTPIVTNTYKACGKTSSVVYYPLTAVDIGPYVSKVVAAHPDFVNMTGIGAQAVQIFKGLGQAGVPANKVATTDVDFTHQLTQSAGGAMNGAYLEAQFTPWGLTSDPEVAQYQANVKAAGYDPRSPTVEWGYVYMMTLYTAAKDIGFGNFNSESLAHWLSTANGVHIPLSLAIKNPGPTGFPQLKQPSQRILQFEGGETFKVVPTGTNKDGWINAFSPGDSLG
jgi:ABC-type branched-subunit amino acid transport system substrate-binding protein